MVLGSDICINVIFAIGKGKKGFYKGILNFNNTKFKREGWEIGDI